MRKWILAAASIVLLAAGTYFAFARVTDTEAKERVEQFAAEMRKHVDKFEYGAVETASAEGSVVIRDIHFTDSSGSNVTISTMVISDFDWKAKDTPSRASIKAKGIVYSINPSRSESNWLHDDFGYDKIGAEAELTYSYDEKTGEFSVHIYAAATDAGTVTYDVKLGGIDPDTIAMAQTAVDNNPMAGMAMMQATLISASLQYEDQSLAARVIKAEAKRRSISEDEVRAEALKSLAASGEGLGDGGAKQANDAVINFVNKPRSITISLSPKQPVPLMVLLLSMATPNGPGNQAAAEKMVKQLGLKVSSN
jgi:hypothetical protein